MSSFSLKAIIILSILLGHYKQLFLYLSEEKESYLHKKKKTIKQTNKTKTITENNKRKEGLNLFLGECMTQSCVGHLR